MIDWAQVVRWRPDQLQQAVAAVNTEYNDLISCSDDLRGIAVPDGWSGPSSAAAMRQARHIAASLDEWAAEIAAARRAIGDVGDAITGVVHGVEEAEALAAKYGFRIDADGTVVDPGLPAGVPEDQREMVVRDRGGDGERAGRPGGGGAAAGRGHRQRLLPGPRPDPVRSHAGRRSGAHVVGSGGRRG